MKIRNVLIGLVVSAILIGAVVSCGGGGGGGSSTPAAAATVVRSASLTFAQETPVPPVTSTATGRGAVVVNPTTLEITGGVTFTGLTGNPTAAHIHTGAAGVSGPADVVTLTLSSDNATATVPPDTKLSDTQYSALLAGNLYFNVHTAANVNGEIRGQITGTTGVTAGLASLTGAQESSTNTSTATGRGTIVLDSTTGAILICYVTHNVTNSTVAHIHTGAPGVSGPANVVDLLATGTGLRTAPVSTTATPTTLAPTAVTDFNAGNTYFNVHSTNNLCAPAANCAAGEIRGQIAVQ